MAIHKRWNPVLLQKRMWVLLVLGFASGLPLGLYGATLQAWYTVSDVSIVAIGLLALVGQPYVYKFLWAPVLDRYVLPFAGRRRGWMLLTQVILIILLLSMACFNPRSSPWILAGLAFLVAFFSATQDIAIDAYRTEILPPEERGTGSAMSVAGYRIAMLASSGLTLILAQFLGFNVTYLIMAGCMGIGVVATLMCAEPFVEPMVLQAGTSRLVSSFFEPLRAFFSRPSAIGFLVLIVLYKMGDAFAGTLTTTFLLRGVGFDLVDVGSINKTVGLFGSLMGVFMGGLLLSRIGLFKALLSFGCLQAVSNLGFVLLAYVGDDYRVLVCTVFIENLCGGMGTAAFLAFLMSLCDKRYTATQFALLTALSAVGRVFVGPVAGLLVECFGWVDFFFITVLLSLPGLGVLWYYRAAIEVADKNQGILGEDLKIS